MNQKFIYMNTIIWEKSNVNKRFFYHSIIYKRKIIIILKNQFLFNLVLFLNFPFSLTSDNEPLYSTENYFRLARGIPNSGKS